ncbi:MAG: DNA N-6-adenine-methyltransferase, partial [Christensenellales bacterium]|nr:DNA N-6-adenine-methyltransferase [Christensenellales bacterium]
MNELITPELSQLPAMPVNDIKDGVDKIGGYIGMLQSAKRATADQTIIDEVNDQIRKYSALKLRWQMELGRRTAELETNITGRPAKNSSNGRTTFETKAEKLKELGISKQRASENERMASEPEIVEKYIERTIEQDEAPTTSGALRAIQESRKPHVTNNSKDNEWYTPSEYIEAAREVLGTIDLDPASNDFANETVKASTYYTEDTNGLLQEWSGNIWMNPPYSTALLSKFADKLAESNFKQAIVLVN